MSVIKNIFLKRESFSVEVPELILRDEGVTALIGPSGSGKSSLIRVLLGLEPLTGWSWNLNGVEISQVPVEKRNFGVVFQSLELFPHMTAKENIEFPLRCRNYSPSQILERTDALMDSLGLVQCGAQKPHQLSGGEKQRVALARALAFRPDYLFLDEPFSSLDQDLKESSRELVRRTLKEFKVPALLVSHDKGDVEALRSSVFMMRKGRVTTI